MSRRPPQSFSDLANTLREIYTFIDGFSGKSINLKGRRIINGAKSIDPNDYVIRQEIPVFSSQTQGSRVVTSGGSVAASSFENVVFGLGIGIPVVVSTDVTPPRPWVNSRNGRPQFTAIVANESPTGSDLWIDIKQNGNSIFTSGFVVLPAGTPNKEIVIHANVYVPVVFSRYDILTCDVLQTGSVEAGQDISVFTFCTLS